MSAPWLRQFDVEDSSGEPIRVREWGDPTGPVVIFHHGTPSSSAAVPGGWNGPAELGIRVLALDRPGYGGSPRQPGRRVADAARWSALVADECGIETFAVMGTSGGGPHAAAAAALLPQRVTRLCIDVGIGPVPCDDFDPQAGMLPETVAELSAATQGESTLRAYIESLGSADVALDSWMDLLPPSDREVLGRTDVRKEEALEAQDWISAGLNGWIDDDLALFREPWGFHPRDISQPTLLAYGGADVLVPSSHGRAYREVIANATLEVIPEAGHWLRDHETKALAWAVRE